MREIGAEQPGPAQREERPGDPVVPEDPGNETHPDPQPPGNEADFEEGEVDDDNVIPPSVEIDPYRPHPDDPIDEPLEAPIGTETPITTTTKSRVPAKFSKNYAAGSCGAKIEKASSDVTVISLFPIII